MLTTVEPSRANFSSHCHAALEKLAEQGRYCQSFEFVELLVPSGLRRGYNRIEDIDRPVVSKLSITDISSIASTVSYFLALAFR